MRPEQRKVAGLYCFEVLERLSDYLDGDLASADRESLEAHVRGCDWCERFGGEMAGLVKQLREQLAKPEPLEPGLLDRLGV
jgi:predicted anti-sigma-YlaC factor YlaD